MVHLEHIEMIRDLRQEREAWKPEAVGAHSTFLPILMESLPHNTCSDGAVTVP